MRIMFVCLGNICRSPTAHAIAETIGKQRGDNYVISSSGTSAYHIGQSPDPRSVQCGLSRGYNLNHIRAQKLEVQDFYTQDYILTMDQQNYLDAKEIMPDDAHAKLMRLMEFHPDSSVNDVPDPYYGGTKGFDEVVSLCEVAITNLFNELGSS
ncbi:low molecular weight protein-tyrosine-phosphatase [Pseudoalteromonas sp. YIC-656]|uniref:low molecular weight protein-tyrosine-phosphatase n=1 Tax=Pseudoalteromonas pernae TaxID=3118054 RepID=UPI00324291F7